MAGRSPAGSRAGAVENPELAYTLTAEGPLGDAARAALVDRLRFFLSLDDDLNPFYALARDDAPFAPVVARRYGLHQVKFLTPFENAAWAVLTQHTVIAAAQQAKRAVTERYGGSVVADGATHRAFPEAGAVVAANLCELRALVGHERRAAALLAVATAFAAVDEAWLRAAPWDEVHTDCAASAGSAPGRRPSCCFAAWGAWSDCRSARRASGRLSRASMASGTARPMR